MLPDTLIKRLCETNQLKQDWRDERLQTVTKSAEIKTESSFTKNYNKNSQSKKSPKIKAIFSHKFSEMSTYNYKMKKKIMIDYAEEIFGRNGKSSQHLTPSQSPKNTSKDKKHSNSKNYISITDPSGNLIPSKPSKSPRSALTVSSFQKLDTPVNNTPSSAEIDEYSFKRQTYRSITTLTTPSKFYKESEDRQFLNSQQSNTSLKDDLIRGFRRKYSKQQQDKKCWTSILESPSEDVETMRKSVAKTFGSLIKDITYSNHYIKDAYRTNEKLKLMSIRGDRKKDKNNYSTSMKSSELNSYSLENITHFPRLEVGSAEVKKFPFFTKTSVKERTKAPPLKFRKTKEEF